MAVSIDGIVPEEEAVEEVMGDMPEEDYPLDPVEEDCGFCDEYTPHQVRLSTLDVETSTDSVRTESYRISACLECSNSSYERVRNL